MQPRRKKTVSDNPLLKRFEEMNEQQKKMEEQAAELKSRPKKTHSTAKTQRKPHATRSEVLRRSKLALTAAISKGALNNVRCSSKEMVIRY